jgi:hypothetical protein
VLCRIVLVPQQHQAPWASTVGDNLRTTVSACIHHLPNAMCLLLTLRAAHPSFPEYRHFSYHAIVVRAAMKSGSRNRILISISRSCGKPRTELAEPISVSPGLKRLSETYNRREGKLSRTGSMGITPTWCDRIYPESRTKDDWWDVPSAS